MQQSLQLSLWYSMITKLRVSIVTTKAWGKRRSKYYGGDVEDEDFGR
jgi:hypothetical protein